MNNIIAITIGDINGIGIDILIKTFKQKKIKNFILFTNINILKEHLKRKKLSIKLNLINKEKNNLNYLNNDFNIFSYNVNSLEENTYHSLKYAYFFCSKKLCIGMITLPLRKDLIKKRISKKFIGHTEFFQDLDNKKFVNMILFHKNIIISPVSTHIQINKVSKFISNKKYLYNQLKNLYKTLIIDFNFSKPKMAISGLNPHAGENGELGMEEKKIIKPVLKRLKNKGLIIDGPFSADSMLIKKNLSHYDCFVFIYHDQALIPFKYISQFSGVNYTGNLDIIQEI